MDTRRSGVLDWARTVAIGLVLLRHGYVSQTDLAGGGSAWPSFAANFALNGWLGVDLFFVLSGFLLSRQLLTREHVRGGATGFVADFWYRRALRILPGYLIVVLPIWILQEWGGEGRTAAGHLQLIAHLLFLQDYFGSDLLVTTWSLATEMKFYLLLPLLVLLSFRASRLHFAAGMLLVSVLVLMGRLLTCWAVAPVNYPDFFWQVRAPFHHALDGLLMGVAAGYLSQANLGWLVRMSRPLAARILSMLLLAAVMLLVSFDWLGASFMLSSVAVWIAALISLGVVLIGVSSENKGDRLVEGGGGISWVASVSYSLYLIHYLMLSPAQTIASSVSQGLGAQQIVFWFFYLTASLVLAWLLHKIVEMPFLRLRDSKPVLAMSKVGD